MSHFKQTGSARIVGKHIELAAVKRHEPFLIELTIKFFQTLMD
jgi:hypothetical protein